MSQPDLTNAPRGMVVQKPKSNIYTALLGVATIALMWGCFMLYTEIWRYAPEGTGFFNVGEVFGAVRGPV